MSNHTNCPLCDKSIAWNNIHKHIFARQHIEKFVQPALLKEKGSISLWKKGTVNSGCPIIWVGNKQLYLCFGCKTAKSHLPSYHLKECKHAEEHLTTLKRLIDTPEIVEQSADASELKKEVEALKKKLKASEREVEMLEEARDDIDVWTEKIFGKSATDMYEYDIERAIEFSKEGKLWKYLPDE